MLPCKQDNVLFAKRTKKERGKVDQRLEQCGERTTTAIKGKRGQEVVKPVRKGLKAGSHSCLKFV